MMSLDRDELPTELQRLVNGVEQPLDPISPKSALERFLSVRRQEVSEGTVKENRRSLENFVRYCELEDIDNLNDLSGRTLDDYYIWRREKSSSEVSELSRKTMRDEMYLFRNFIEYLEGIEAVEPGLHERIRIPTLEPGDGVRDIELEPERARQILDHLRKYEYASREHVVWLLHCHTGRRPGGLHSLDVEDFQFEADEPYVQFKHWGDSTRLKNGLKSQNQINLSPEVAEPIADYIEQSRHEIEEQDGRRPLLTSKEGRLAKSTMRKYFYKWTRPCEITGECPHDRDIDDCEAAQSSDSASKCPSSRPPYASRHGYITAMRRAGMPKALLSERCDVSEDVLDRHYDERDVEEKRELRREVLEKIHEESGGYVE